jgi:CDP-diacylglycerol--glycerol-3-phosphate 3-phosphatidyltransferase
MVVLTREFAVSGLRMVAAADGTVIAAGWSGKVKTFTTMVGLCIMILPGIPAVVNTVIVAVIVVTTVYSGIEYFLKNWSVFNFKK